MADFWTLPHLGLLQSNLMGGSSIDRDLLISRAAEIGSTLGSFDVAVTVVEVRPGPLFTAFHLDLAAVFYFHSATNSGKMTETANDQILPLAPGPRKVRSRRNLPNTPFETDHRHGPICCHSRIR
jgi:DNA segregation ATPase FtsK/SpoIIIE-like protein